MPKPVKLSYRHEDIARWLLQNPHRPLSDCAREFGYTQSWLSCIIHSDAFQAKLRRMQKEADEITILDIPARLRGIASEAIDALGAQLELAKADSTSTVHRQFLLDTAELTLKSLGYGPAKSSSPVIQNNQFNTIYSVSPDVLNQAREKLLSITEAPTAISQTGQLPAGEERDGGALLGQPPALPASSTAEGPQEARIDL